jgi:hypothetical protein
MHVALCAHSLFWLVGYIRQGSPLIGLFPIPVDTLAYMYSSLCSPLIILLFSHFSSTFMVSRDRA